ncbi:hypothetical protein H9I48_06135, partial [Wolbachia pipientis]|nr:hypothetical protein [Wolbachia pipientis]
MRYRRGMTVCGSMTVRGGIVIRHPAAGSMLRDTANESRYDVGLQVSCQCSFFCH